MSRDRRIKQACQCQRMHEKRTYDALTAQTAVLARDIRRNATLTELSTILDVITEWKTPLRSTLLRMGISAAFDHGTTTIGHFGVKSAIDEMKEAITRYLSLYTEQQSQAILSTLKDQVRVKLESGQEKKSILREVLLLIKDPVWVQRISRTHIHSSTERGAWEAAMSLGLRMKKEWAAVEDGEARPDHARADGQMMEINQPFSVGNEYLMYPGDPDASARQVVNCRCTALYYLMDNGEILR